MALSNFYITVALTGPASATVAGQAATYQIITPWGQTAPCAVWQEALNQAFMRVNPETGIQGAYFNAGTTNGLTTNSQTVPATANNIVGLA